MTGALATAFERCLDRRAPRGGGRLGRRSDALAALLPFAAGSFEDLPFGSIKLDEHGRVVVYNAAEAKLARRSQEGTLGKLFFEEIAPCTNNEIFKGKLDELVRTGKKTAQFEYRFMFPWGAKFVRIQLWVPDARSRWIFVLPIEAQAPVHVPG